MRVTWAEISRRQGVQSWRKNTLDRRNKDRGFEMRACLENSRKRKNKSG